VRRAAAAPCKIVASVRRSAAAPRVRGVSQAGVSARRRSFAVAATSEKTTTIVDAAVADPQFSVLVEAVVKVRPRGAEHTLSGHLQRWLWLSGSRSLSA